MIIAIIAYFVSFFCVTRFKKVKLKKTNFPHLKMSKSGISFFSESEQTIKVGKVKLMQVKNLLYLKIENNIIIISNVKDSRIIDNNLTFKCLGNVKILFDCSKYYRYFLLEFKSHQFNLNKQKQIAILDLLNNNFDINFCKYTKKYIKIIQNVLNIHVFKEKIVIKKNKFKLSYVVSYKINNIVKRVRVNETI